MSSRLVTITKLQCCELPAEGARVAACTSCSNSSRGTGSGLSRRIARFVSSASKRSIGSPSGRGSRCRALPAVALDEVRDRVDVLLRRGQPGVHRVERDVGRARVLPVPGHGELSVENRRRGRRRVRRARSRRDRGPPRGRGRGCDRGARGCRRGCVRGRRGTGRAESSRCRSARSGSARGWTCRRTRSGSRAPAAG